MLLNWCKGANKLYSSIGVLRAVRGGRRKFSITLQVLEGLSEALAL